MDYPFHCLTTLQLRYSDFDMQQIINNSIYFNYFDLGKIDYFDRVKQLMNDLSKANIVVAHLDVDYFFPITTAEQYQIAVETQIVQVGNKSLTLLQRIVNTETKQVKCSCRSVMVYLDEQTFEPTVVPEFWRNAINDFEHRDCGAEQAE